jgi:hypothetical protein
MSTTSWVVHARGAVSKAWRKARFLAWVRDLRSDVRGAKRANSNSGWWSELQDRWAEEDLRQGERWVEREGWY